MEVIMAVANTRVVNGINTRILHNKDYVEVAERIRIVHELKKEFEVIESQPVQFADRCIWRVVVKVDGKQYIGNAEAKMNAPKNSPDGTNPFECAETSALGRALAFAGLGTVESIASYDEIARSQPFVAVIEEPKERVVESGNAPRQLRPALASIPPYTELREVSECLFPGKWEEVKKRVLKADVADGELTPDQCARIHGTLLQSQQKAEKNKAAGGGR
jgi:hypothetical protein